MMTCDGCGREVHLNPCMACVIARHRAVLKRRCACAKKDRRETDVKRIGSRSWISCFRCLGQVRQLT